MSIMIIENNPNDEKLAVMAFKQTHPSVKLTVFRNGLDAIDHLLSDRTVAPPNLILLDLKMPRINGLEVLRRLRHDHRTQLIPVVILSSSAEPEDMTQAYILGANSYISKPMDYDAFVDVVDYLKVYWLDINQLPKLLVKGGK